MARNYVFAPGEYYHIYNRGVEKRQIFLNKNDYERFQFALYACNSTKRFDAREYKGLTFGDKFKLERLDTLVDIGAYCLMPNHFHILIREKVFGGISKFMQKLNTSYTMYFNKINKRTGSLLEGSYRARHADTDEYLKYLFAYIHLNPIKLIDSTWKEVGIHDPVATEKYLGDYAFSSHHDFLANDRHEKAILSRESFPEYFQETTDFQKFIADWMHFKAFADTKVKPL